LVAVLVFGSMQNLFTNFSKWSKAIVALVLVITLGAFYFSSHLKFDYDFESFFPTDDKDLQFYLDYRQQFEYDNEFVLVGIENNKGIFNASFLKRVQALTDSVKKIHNVTKVLSPSTVKQSIIAPVGFIEVPFLHIDDSTRYATDSALIYQSPELIGSVFPADAKSVALFIKTKEGIAKLPSDTLLIKLEKLLASFNFEKTHVAGKMKAQYVYIDRIQKEFVIFLFTSLFLVIIFLYFSFRSFWGIWIPVVVVLLSIAWVLGFMGLINKPLDIMMVLLPTMLFVVGMSDVVHVLTKYLEELREGKEKNAAFITTIKDVGLPTFITLLSTAIGFLSLLYSSIKPIRDFGIYTSIGILVAFILSFTFLPALILLRKKPILLKQKNEELFWSKNLHRLLLWTFKHKKRVSIGTVIILCASVFGISRIVVNNNLLEDIVDTDSLKQDFYFFEKHYSGVRPFEMSVKLKDPKQQLFDYAAVAELNKLENYLQKDYGVGFIYSPLTILKSLNRALNNGNPAYYTIPNDTASYNEVMQLYQKIKKRPELKTLITPNEKWTRITGKMNDIGSLKVRNLDKNLTAFIEKNLTPNVFEFELTGAAVMIDKNNEYLVYNMLQGLLLSVLVVALIIALIHRSLKIVIISIIPNIVPMLLIGGLMGYLGIEMKISTSIIFSIAFGIATDDTIHLLARLKLELDKGKSFLYALKRTYISTGKAVVVTSLILSAGFLTLVLSDFQSTFYFGVLVSVILFLAVIVDLLLLPLLLLWMIRKR
jgi:uncharacterized protein